jgi:iron complex outermembrane recepter protein
MGEKGRVTLRRIVAAVGLGASACAWAQQEKPDLGSLGIEDLMRIEVVTASRSAQAFKNVPAAIFVLTGEEIVRAGVQNIPDMLRLVPGVNVAQVSANIWMISIRGFNLRYSNKLQVLIDGQSIYTPLFSGVNWDEFNIPPDQIDRIEVIRGPGGAIWGANAVNGVINIITKNAADTQGVRIETAKGDPMLDQHRVRIGGKSGERGYYRVYAEYMGFDDLQPEIDAPAGDGWRALRGGFRLDGSPRDGETYTVNGYGSRHRLGQVSTFPSLAPPYFSVDVSDWWNSHWRLNASWSKVHASGGSSEWRAGYVAIERNDPDVSTRRGTLDVEYRSERPAGDSARTIWGGSFRQTSDRADSPAGLFVFDPRKRTDRVYGAFVQHEKSVGNGLTATFGTTLEHNDYTGWEVQPSARIAWDRNPKETYWASLARAVRVPSRAESDATFPVQVLDVGQPIPMEILLTGNPNMLSERLIALEFGARYQPHPKASYDLAAFLNWYDALRTFEPVSMGVNPSPTPHIESLFRFDNKGSAFSGGIEASGQFLPRPNWKLVVNFALLSDKFRLDDDSQDAFGERGTDRMGSSPRYTISVRSAHDLGRGLTFDLFAQYVDKLPAFGIKAYTRLDAKVAYKASDRLEVSLVGQNLLQGKHKEARGVLFETASFIPRGFYGMATWRY